MNTKSISIGLAGLIMASLAFRSSEAQKLSAPSKSKLAVSIKPKHVADALRAVILSDREVYTQLRTEHQRDSGQTAKPLPSPCEMLRLGSQAVASKGVEYSYLLRSLQPVNPRNAAETDVETKGLQFVGTRPDLTYTAEELLGGRWYYTTVYPDVAINQSCVACHNQQPSTAGKQFKVGEVIGGLVIRIAIEL